MKNKEIKKDFSKEPPKEVKWQKEYCYTSDDFMVVPVCPSCGEFAYEENECVFCHQKFIYTPIPKEYESTIITIGEWTITQVYGSWGVYIEHNGKEIMHTSCAKKLSKNKLKEWLKTYVKEK